MLYTIVATLFYFDLLLHLSVLHNLYKIGMTHILSLENMCGPKSMEDVQLMFATLTCMVEKAGFWEEELSGSVGWHIDYFTCYCGTIPGKSQGRIGLF